MRKIIWIFSVFLFFSCSEEKECFTGYGDTITETRDVEPFSAVYLSGRVDVDYRRASDYRIEVTFGDKIIQSIKTEVDAGILRVSNETTCNWLRDPGKFPKITLFAPDFVYLENRLSGDLTFRDTLLVESFKYEQWESNGEIKLLLHTDTARIYAHVGYTRLEVVGTTDRAEIYTGSSGPVLAHELRAQTVLSNNSSIQDLTVYSGEYLYGFIGRTGDILYSGDPATVEKTIVGTGEVKPY